MSRRGVALVTGSSSGIGKETAIRLSNDGWKVVLSARREKELREAAELCQGETLVHIGDVSKEEDVLKLFQEIVKTFGRLDVVFNNAGISGAPEAMDAITASNFTSVMNVNVTASVLCAREAFKLFKQQNPSGGRIINNGSLAAYTPRPHALAYTVSKHAISGLTKTIALEGRSFNISATQIDIGNAETAMTAETQQGGRLQADGTIRSEPVMNAGHVADAIVHIANLPNDVQVLNMAIMAAGMPFVGRG
ncbi:hypothetical protein FRB95_007329 [Tulasnella sp. JGI-2019a]|nr:hypothetical protein FRB95_007329 [Tulasnella sp. JGI-2019a]